MFPILEQKRPGAPLCTFFVSSVHRFGCAFTRLPSHIMSFLTLTALAALSSKDFKIFGAVSRESHHIAPNAFGAQGERRISLDQKLVVTRASRSSSSRSKKDTKHHEIDGIVSVLSPVGGRCIFTSSEVNEEKRTCKGKV